MASKILLTILVVCCFLMSPISLGQAADPRNNQPNQPANKNKGDMRAIIREMIKELDTALREQDEWPRKESNYSDDKNVSLPAEDVIKALGSRLDRRPGVDAYLKWQLLSFIEDDSVLVDPSIMRVFKNLPALFKLPEPAVTQKYSKNYAQLITLISSTKLEHPSVTSTRRSFTTTPLEDISKLPGSYIVVYQDMITDYQHARSMVDLANKANLAYRDELSRRLPESHPVRLSFLLTDSLDRANAQERTYRRILDETLKLFEKNRLNRDLSRSARKTLSQQVMRMNVANTLKTMTRAQIDKEGNVNVDVIYMVIPDSHKQAMISYLRAEQPKVLMLSWDEIDDDLRDEED